MSSSWKSPFFFPKPDMMLLNFQTSSDNSIEQDGSDRPGNVKDAEKEDVYQLGKILLQIIVGKLVKSPAELDDQRLMVHTLLNSMNCIQDVE